MRIGRFVFLTALAVAVLFAVFSLTAQLSMSAAAKAPDKECGVDGRR